MEPLTLASWLDNLFDRVEMARNMDVENEQRATLYAELSRRNFADEQRGIAEAYIIGGNWRFKSKPYRLEVSDFYPTPADVQHLQTQTITAEYFQTRIKQLRTEIRVEEEHRARVAYSESALSERLSDATRLMVEKTRLLMVSEKRADELQQQVNDLRKERLPLLQIVRRMLEEEARAINHFVRVECMYSIEWGEEGAPPLLPDISKLLALPMPTELDPHFGESGMIVLPNGRINWSMKREALNKIDISTEITTLSGVRKLQWLLRNTTPIIFCIYTKAAEILNDAEKSAMQPHS